jgi:tetratricopeptide (TPR) repeat protein
LEGRHGQARDSFQRSLGLGENAERRSWLGVAQSRLGDWPAARQSWTRAVELDADDKLATYYLGIDANIHGDYQAAAAWWRRSLKARPDDTDAMNNLAWLLATCPRDDIRNGKEALKLASQACKSWPNDQRQSALDTLAAAQAEVGDFDAAVATCREAIAMARKANDKALAADIQSRLAAYQARKPCREKPTPTTSTRDCTSALESVDIPLACG